MPRFYETPWAVSALLVRSTGCFFGSLAAGVIWPKGRYAVAFGLVAAHLGLDIWSVASFHILQPWDETASGWMPISLLTKAKWIVAFTAATAVGSVAGNPVGVAIRNWFVKAWISAGETGSE